MNSELELLDKLVEAGDRLTPQAAMVLSVSAVLSFLRDQKERDMASGALVAKLEKRLADLDLRIEAADDKAGRALVAQNFVGGN